MLPTDVADERARLLELGAEDTKSLTSALFFYDPAVGEAFRHNGYGYSNSRKSTFFPSKDKGGQTRWFRSHQPLNRARAHLEVARREQETPTFLFAHDFPYRASGKPSKVIKVYGALTAWDFLWSLSRTENEKKKATNQVFAANALRPFSQLSHEEQKTGQLLGRWPCASLYAFRPFDYEAGDYAFTLDVDGKCCMSAEDRETKNQAVARAVIAEFEGTGEGEPRLRVIGEKVKRLVRSCFRYDGELYISWHRSTGWKPSWRGYLVGPVFKNLGTAKFFVREHLLPALNNEHADWFVDGVVDEAAYNRSGQDRCLGSAKHELVSADEMRFLQMCPLVDASDRNLTELFHACPNEYILVVTGLMYRRDFDGSFLQLEGIESSGLEKQKRKKKALAGPGKKRSTAPVDNPDRTADVNTDAAVALVGEILHGEGLLPTARWTGYVERAQELASGKLEIRVRAHDSETFCLFKYEKGGRHSSGGKIVFRLVVSPSAEEVQLSQKCYSCNEKSFGHIATKRIDASNLTSGLLKSTAPGAKGGSPPKTTQPPKAFDAKTDRAPDDACEPADARGVKQRTLDLQTFAIKLTFV